MDTANVELQNVMLLYVTVALRYSRDLAQLVSDRVKDDKHDGIDSGIRINGEALEADLFEQNAQMRR